MSERSFDPTLPTGQGSATDIFQLAYQPGYWQPWEQRDPVNEMQAHADYVLADEDPLAHVDWKEQRTLDHLSALDLAAEPK